MTMPAGFELTYYATGVPGARSMVRSEADPRLLYVSTRTDGNIYAVLDMDNDGTAEQVVTVASNLNLPNGIVWHQGSLFVLEATQLIRFDDIDMSYATSPSFTKVEMGFDLPTANSQWHGWKVLRVGPDDRLYFTVGSPCNYCLDETTVGDPKPTDNSEPFGTLCSILTDGSDFQVHARGIRNSVGFDFTPTGDIVFTDNGRDEWGPDQPQDEFNFLDMSLPKQHFGFPHCYVAGGSWDASNKLPDPNFTENGSCEGYVGATAGLGPHTAALGVKFYTASAFPAPFNTAALVALHGSWNRPAGMLSGYKVVAVLTEDYGRTVTDVVDLVSGWLNPDNATKWGRPVDVLPLADGTVLISDDFGGNIFRLTYKGNHIEV